MGEPARLLGCPFCGEQLRHVESWARSFDPPRLYHEYHHDNVACVLGKKYWPFDDNAERRAAWVAIWNARAALPAAGLVEAAARAIYALRPDGATQWKLTGTTGDDRRDRTQVFTPDTWEEASEQSRQQCLEFARAALDPRNIDQVAES